MITIERALEMLMNNTASQMMLALAANIVHFWIVCYIGTLIPKGHWFGGVYPLSALVWVITTIALTIIYFIDRKGG